MTFQQSRSAEVRARIGHPVVDTDGHIMEYMPLVQSYIRQECERQHVDTDIMESGALAGLLSARTLSASALGGAPTSGSDPRRDDRPTRPADWHQASLQERQDWRLTRPIFWLYPTKHTLDTATSRLPALFAERFGELGFDYAVLYPTFGLAFPRLPDGLRQVACRGFNRYLADLYGDLPDVMTPAAVIPAHTPQEAIEELEFAVGTLGLKVVVLPSYIRRPVPAVKDLAPGFVSYATYVDKIALDSEYDYDPLWRRCVELKVSPTFHSSTQDWDSRNSPSNYVYNHLGHFAVAAEAICKALFLGGVTYRFPQLAFAFLEGGVGWAANLYADLVGHWEKRNGGQASTYSLESVDHQLLLDLVERYGNPRLVQKMGELAGQGFFAPDSEDPATLDEFREVHVDRVEEIKERFVANFFFGCEADDPINSYAFNTKVNPFRARLNAVFGSDIGHWDVPDAREVLEEAYELVDNGLITEADFRDFVFTNPVNLHTRLNKDFFRGTAIEGAVAALLNNEVGGSRALADGMH